MVQQPSPTGLEPTSQVQTTAFYLDVMKCRLQENKPSLAKLFAKVAMMKAQTADEFFTAVCTQPIQLALRNGDLEVLGIWIEVAARLGIGSSPTYHGVEHS
jgi:hypothetical protein